ncbi:hypothetical protein BD626DRAFT_520336 [Schizophyllum amplum]|uniref:Uncharacterized protein n=1 Tax=Schizophyllum amplum TaxID=97359 RepID=A0A550BUQ2_9AGAR|nr:hypothetical protein BD626DRAFT_520336 [Auriculariopsis ampla]
MGIPYYVARAFSTAAEQALSPLQNQRPPPYGDSHTPAPSLFAGRRNNSTAPLEAPRPRNPRVSLTPAQLAWV